MGRLLPSSLARDDAPFLLCPDTLLQCFIRFKLPPTGIVQLIFLPQLMFPQNPLDEFHAIGNEYATNLPIKGDRNAAKGNDAGAVIEFGYVRHRASLHHAVDLGDPLAGSLARRLSCRLQHSNRGRGTQFEHGPGPRLSWRHHRRCG